MHDNLQGILWWILHCVLAAILFSITKHVLNQFHVFEIIFFQTLLATIFLIPFAAMKFKKHRISNLKLHAIRALLWVSGAAMYFYAITQVTLAKVVAVLFTIPVFSMVLAIFILKEQISKYSIFALVCGVIGMIFIINPGYSYEAGTLYAVGGAFLFASANIIIKILTRTHPPVTKAICFTAFSALFSFPLFLKFGNIPDLHHFRWLSVVALIFTLDLIAISKALQHTKLTIVMPFTFTELLFATIIGYTIFNESINVATVIGAIIIIIGVAFVGYFNTKTPSRPI